MAQCYLLELKRLQTLKLIINALRLYELAIIWVSAASVRDFKDMHICLCLIESQNICMLCCRSKMHFQQFPYKLYLSFFNFMQSKIYFGSFQIFSLFLILHNATRMTLLCCIFINQKIDYLEIIVELLGQKI